MIDVEVPTSDATIRALEEALAPTTRKRIQGGKPLGDGHSAARIVSILAEWTPPKPPFKRPLELARA